MKAQDLLIALINANGEPQGVENIDGAFDHGSVAKNTYTLREVFFTQVVCLSTDDQSSFIKSLALYEQTVGGLGSVTLLPQMLEIVDDSDHTLFDWVLANTNSCNYFAGGAKSFAELQRFKELRNARVKAIQDREAQRENEAKIRRAKKASSNLINAINRGDIKAVKGLLLKGASTDTLSDDGLLAVDFAEKSGYSEIAELIKNWNNKP